MLKKGDLIICDGSTRTDGAASWWVMTRDETLDDRLHTYINAEIVSYPRLEGFEDAPGTSWDSETISRQGVRVVPADEWTDEMYAQVAKWALLMEAANG